MKKFFKNNKGVVFLIGVATAGLFLYVLGSILEHHSVEFGDTIANAGLVFLLVGLSVLTLVCVAIALTFFLY